MAHVAEPPSHSGHAGHETPDAPSAAHQPLVTPGKVAMWLFLATEIMFFTGLIGSYIVLRAGTPPTAFSNFFAPATNLDRVSPSLKGLILVDPGPIHEEVVKILEESTTLDRMQTEELDKKLKAIEDQKL